MILAGTEMIEARVIMIRVVIGMTAVTTATKLPERTGIVITVQRIMAMIPAEPTTMTRPSTPVARAAAIRIINRPITADMIRPAMRSTTALRITLAARRVARRALPARPRVVKGRSKPNFARFNGGPANSELVAEVVHL